MAQQEISIKKIKEVCMRPGYHLCWFRRLSFYATLPILYTKITPTQITWASLILGLAAIGLFYPGTYVLTIIAALTICTSTLLDHMDGNIARFKQQFSDKGYFLDGIYTIFGVPLLFLSIGFGGYHATGNILWVLAGIITMYGFLVREALTHVISMSELKGKKDTKNVNATGTVISKRSQIINKILPTHYDHVCYGLCILSFFGLAHWVLVYFGIMYNVLWIGKAGYNYLYAFKN